MIFLVQSKGGAASLGEKLDMEWLTFGAEFPALKEDQFKRDFDHIMKDFKHKVLGTRSLWNEARFRL